jgi:ABC-type Fe3+/spermidine/putrescine transport system ATPase subunit
MSNSDPIKTGLRVHNLVIGYQQPLTSALNFSVGPGEILVIVGQSGCGKSTLLSTLAGVIQPLDGGIFLDEQNLSGVPIHKRSIGLVFQDPLLFPHLSLIDNIGYSLRVSGQSKDASRARATELLEWVGLSEIAGQKTWQLSGGQAGRVALARAIAAQPAVLLLDEPYSALDSPTRLRLLADVKDLVTREGIPTIHVTHDHSEAEMLATSIVTL